MTRELTLSWALPLCGALALAATASATGCLFAPAIEQFGYNACAADDECASGRACRGGLCTPPPWNDPGFGTRQVITVTNESEEELSSDASVPLRIGEGGLLGTAELGVDGRLTFYDWDVAAWREVPAYRDLYDSYLNLYVRLQGPVAPGASVPLAWLESNTGANDARLLEEPTEVFTLFDDLDLAVLPADRWTSHGLGEPIGSNGKVTVVDNQKLVSVVPLSPPLSLTFRGRINGVNCESVFLGLLSDDGPGYTTPSVGFFVTPGLRTELEVAPTAESVPRMPADLDAYDLDTAEHAFGLDVADGAVRFTLDGITLGEPRLSPRFAGESLYFAIDVDGPCSFDLERVFSTPLPFTRPVLTATEQVEFELVD